MTNCIANFFYPTCPITEITDHRLTKNPLPQVPDTVEKWENQEFFNRLAALTKTTEDLSYEQQWALYYLTLAAEKAQGEDKLDKAFRASRDLFAVLVSIFLALGEAFVATAGMINAFSKEGLFHAASSQEWLLMLCIIYTLSSAFYANFFLIKSDVQSEVTHMLGARYGKTDESFLPEGIGKKIGLILFGLLCIGSGACYGALSQTASKNIAAQSNLFSFAAHPFFSTAIPIATGIGMAFLFFAGGASLLRDSEKTFKKIKEKGWLMGFAILALAILAAAIQFPTMADQLSHLTLVNISTVLANVLAGLNLLVCVVFNTMKLYDFAEVLSTSSFFNALKSAAWSLFYLLMTPLAPLIYLLRQIIPASEGKNSFLNQCLTETDAVFSSSAHFNSIGQALLFSAIAFQADYKCHIVWGVVTFLVTYTLSVVPNMMAMQGELHNNFQSQKNVTSATGVSLAI